MRRSESSSAARLSILPRKAAAAALGISQWKLSQITADGSGKIQQGRRGRNHATLYDTEVLTAVVQAAQDIHQPPSRERLEQLERGARALTMRVAIAARLRWIERTHTLDVYGVPEHQHAAVLAFIEQQILGCVAEHLRLEEND